MKLNLPFAVCRSPFALLLLLVGLCFFYNLGGAPLYDRDEGAFSEATREMFERNDFLSTYLNGEPRHDKPILTYWAQTLGVTLLGFNETGLRIHSAIAAAIWIFAVYWFVRKLADIETAFVAAALNAVALFVILIGRLATADALLNLFLALSLFEIYRYFQEINERAGRTRRKKEEGTRQKVFILHPSSFILAVCPAPTSFGQQANSNKHIYRAYLWIALGVLTKGPIAIVIPFAVSFLFFALRRQVNDWLRFVLNSRGWLIFAVVALPWYVVQTVKDGGAFLNGFLFRHNIERYGSTLESHGGSIFYYVPLLFVIVHPFGYWLFQTFFQIKNARRDSLDSFLWLWFGFVFVFFSFAGTKLPHYLLYGATPLFILMARHRAVLRVNALALFPAMLFFAVWCVVPFLIEPGRAYINKVEVLSMLDLAREVFDLRFQLWLFSMLLITIALVFVTRWQTWRVTLIAGVVNALATVQILMPALGFVLQNPTREAARFVQKQNLENVVTWKLDAPSFSVYRGQATPHRQNVRTGETVVTRVDKLRELPNHKVVFQRGAIAIANVEETE